MRILFYTRPAYFDTTLPLIRALSERAEVHVVLEVAPESQRSGIVNLDILTLRRGLQPADPVLRETFPPHVRDYWRDVASFNLLIHDCPRSIHPATWRVSRELPRLVRRIRPDVLHLEEASLRLMSALPGLPRVPVILRVHDPEAHSGEQGWRRPAAEFLVRRRVTRYVLFSKRLVPAFLEKNRFAADRTDVIPLGPLTFFRAWLNPDSDNRADSNRHPTVLFFGRLSPYKGLDILYQSLPTVAMRVPGLRVIVAGRLIDGYTPPCPPRLPNDGEVEVIEGYIRNETLATLFSRATLVVCPYLDATQSGVVMNAFGFGVPVVATRTGGIPEYIEEGKTGLLVDPGDAEQLADAVSRFLTDDTLRGRLTAGVASLTQGAGCWPAIADTMMATYARAITASQTVAKRRDDG